MPPEIVKSMRTSCCSLGTLAPFRSDCCFGWCPPPFCSHSPTLVRYSWYCCQRITGAEYENWRDCRKVSKRTGESPKSKMAVSRIVLCTMCPTTQMRPTMRIRQGARYLATMVGSMIARRCPTSPSLPSTIGCATKGISGHIASLSTLWAVLLVASALDS